MRGTALWWHSTLQSLARLPGSTCAVCTLTFQMQTTKFWAPLCFLLTRYSPCFFRQAPPSLLTFFRTTPVRCLQMTQLDFSSLVVIILFSGHRVDFTCRGSSAPTRCQKSFLRSPLSVRNLWNSGADRSAGDLLCSSYVTVGQGAENPGVSSKVPILAASVFIIFIDEQRSHTA